MRRPAPMSMIQRRQSTARTVRRALIPWFWLWPVRGLLASASGSREAGAEPGNALCAPILSCCASAHIFCASVPPQLGSLASMRFPASGPLFSSRNLSVNSEIISSFGASVSAISPMRRLRDGAGCGGGRGSRNPARSRAHSPTPDPPRCRRHGCAINVRTELACRTERPSHGTTSIEKLAISC